MDSARNGSYRLVWMKIYRLIQAWLDSVNEAMQKDILTVSGTEEDGN